ncbi:MAG: site-specific DNA-methyltransferase [Deltaproteobacteria bacterium]|nr:site-specific DNA-methyltransferase [Deltaproteobacteria bacterium]
MLPFLTTTHGALYDEDCLDLLAAMKEESVDCVFADPPFNLGKDYKNGFDDRELSEAYFEWCSRWLVHCCRVTKLGGAVFVYALPELAIRFAEALRQSLTFRHWIALSMKGSFPRGRKLYPAHYALLYFTKGTPKTFNKLRLPVPTCRHCGKEIKDYGGHRDKLNPLGLNLTDFWDDTSPNRHRKYKVRPGVNELKPVIPERAILLSTEPGDLVFDPFGGGGSTYQVAEANDRCWIGSEAYGAELIGGRLREAFPESVGKPPQFDLGEIVAHEDHEHSILRRRSAEDFETRVGRAVPRSAGNPVGR